MSKSTKHNARRTTKTQPRDPAPPSERPWYLGKVFLRRDEPLVAARAFLKWYEAHDMTVPMGTDAGSESEFRLRFDQAKGFYVQFPDDIYPDVYRTPPGEDAEPRDTQTIKTEELRAQVYEFLEDAYLMDPDADTVLQVATGTVPNTPFRPNRRIVNDVMDALRALAALPRPEDGWCFRLVTKEQMEQDE